MDANKKKNIYRIMGVLAVVAVLFFLTQSTQNKDTNTAGNIPPVPGVPAGVPLADPESVGNVITEKESGKEYLSNQVIVEFLPEVSEEEALQIIASAGGAMLQRFTRVPLFLVQVKDAGDGVGAARAIAELSKNPKVKKAELNYLTIKEPSAP